MPPDTAVRRTDSGFARLSGSPYGKVADVRLREDSQGNIEGVEYLAGLSGYDTEDDYKPSPSRPPSVGRPQPRSFKHRYSNGGSRRTSQASKYRSSVDDKKSCPNSRTFMLSSPEMSCKEESTDDDIPKFSLAEGYIPRTKPSIRKSPLLNKDLLRLLNWPAAGDALELEPMIFAMSEDEDRGRAGAGGVSPELTGTCCTQALEDEACETTYLTNDHHPQPVVGASALRDERPQDKNDHPEARSTMGGDSCGQLDGDNEGKEWALSCA